MAVASGMPAHVARHIVKPRQQLDVTTRFANPQAIAELASRKRLRLLARHALGDELVNERFDVKDDLLIERPIDARGAKDVGKARERARTAPQRASRDPWKSRP